MAASHRILAISGNIVNGFIQREQITELDLPVGFSFELDRGVIRITDDNKITRAAALGFDLDLTPRNLKAVEQFTTPAIFKAPYIPLNVSIWVGATRLNYEKLQVAAYSERDKKIECEIYDGDEHWMDLAKATKIADLDWGAFTFSLPNVESNQENNFVFQSGNGFIWLPLLDVGNGGGTLKVTEVITDADSPDTVGDFIVPEHGLPIGENLELQFFTDGIPPSPLVNGATYLFGIQDEKRISLSNIIITSEGNGNHFVRTNNWEIKDLRPLFSVPGLLVEGFKQKGYEFTGEVLGSGLVKRYWQYILRSDFQDNEGNRAFARFEGLTTIDQNVTGGTTVFFADEVQDNSSAFSSNDRYTNNFSAPLELSVTVSLQIENQNGFNVTPKVGIVVPFGQTKTSQQLVGAGQTVLVEFTEQITLQPGGFFFINVNTFNGTSTPNLIVKVGSGLVVSLVEFKGILPGATIQLNELIEPELTLYDCMMGFTHLGDFRFSDNLNTKTVTVYPAEDTTIFEDSLQGFYKPLSAMRDWSARIEPESQTITPRDEMAERYISLQFASSSDKYISEVLKLPKESPLHGRKIDLGANFKDETFVSASPLYEPTAEHRVGGVQVPALWDNTNYLPSFSIKPRILYAVGWVQQQFTTGGIEQGGDPVSTISKYRFEGTQKNFLPYATQLAGVQVFDGVDTFQPPQNVVYADTDFDLFRLFWQKGRFTRSTMPAVTFRVRVRLDEFLNEDFRQRCLITYNGHPYLYYLDYLEDFSTDGSNWATGVFTPQPLL